MQRRTPTDISDLLEIIRRHWPWLVAPTFIALFLMLILSAKLPKSYRADTVIMVDPQKLPAELIKSPVTEDAGERLQMIQQQILSRTQLQKIIDQFKLYQPEKGTAEDIID